MRTYLIMFLLFLFQNSFCPDFSKEEKQKIEKNYTEMEHQKHLQLIEEEKDKRDLSILKHLKMTNKFNKIERKKVREVCDEVGITTRDLYRIFRIESGGDPQAVNKQKGDTLSSYHRVLIGRATGLIGWLPSTAIGCGTTTIELFKMTTLEQLDYVKTYLEIIKAEYTIKDFLGWYLAIFRPEGIGKPDNFVLGHKDGKIYRQNKPLDIDKDSIITVKDVRRFVSMI